MDMKMNEEPFGRRNDSNSWLFDNSKLKRQRNHQNERIEKALLTPLTMLAQMKLRTEQLEKERRNKDITLMKTRRKQNSFKTVKKSTLAWRDYYTWVGVALAISTSILFVIAGLIMLSQHSTVTGWLLVGAGLLTALLVIVLVTIYHRIKLAEHKRRIDEAAINTKNTIFHKKLSDFPPDPVLRRGIIDLVYHGQGDCQECKRMREQDSASDVYAKDKNHVSLASSFSQSSKRSNNTKFQDPAKSRKQSASNALDDDESRNVSLNAVYIAEKYRITTEKRKRESEKLLSPETFLRVPSNRNNNSLELKNESNFDFQANFEPLRQKFVQDEKKQQSKFSLPRLNLRNRTLQHSRWKSYTLSQNYARSSRAQAIQSSGIDRFTEQANPSSSHDNS